LFSYFTSTKGFAPESRVNHPIAQYPRCQAKASRLGHRSTTSGRKITSPS
jgi:hypothetical protein